MKKLISLLKATAVGGLIFLVPVVVAVAILAKGLQLMKLIARPFEAWLPEAPGEGVLLVNLLALAVLGVLCLLAGLAAKSAPGRRLAAGLESKLSGMVPGYGFIKGFTDSFAQSDQVARSFAPVIARFDDNAQIAFEVERTESGNVVLYLPGAPNPWGGSVVYMSADRVEPLGLSMAEAIKNVQRLGRGSGAIASEA